MANRIGPHTFPYMFGNPPVPKVEVEVITKPGEDGHIRRRIGVREPQFDVRTQGFYATEKDARDALQIFGNMIGESPTANPDTGQVAYTFEKDDVNYTTDLTENFRVSVLNVQQNQLQKKACIAGTPNRWFLETNWTLIPVPVS